MNLKRSVLIWVGIVALLGSVVGGASAGPLDPRVPPHPPVTPPIPASQEQATGVELELPPLKAVLLVGPIDGDNGDWTNQEKANMDLAAAELEANGVTVYKFYTPNNDWNQIKAAASGAHFLLYRGHGVYWSSMPYPDVGGFSLKNRFVSPDDIRNDLALAPNAIIMLYGCFTAGSAGNDEVSIDSAEARRRVAQYSDPFFDIGAAGYYADWFGNAFQMYVRYLFQGRTQQETYESFYDFNSATVERYTHPDHPDMVLWLDKDYWYDPLPQYNNAFVGQPEKTLTDLFQPATMQVSPPSVVYLAEPSYATRSFTLSIEAAGTYTFSWTAAVTPTAVSWMSLSPAGGTSGQVLSAVITPTATLGTYQTNIRILADDPELQDYDQTIPVTLYVVERVYLTYLPICAR
jgi:hypothetical protein